MLQINIVTIIFLEFFIVPWISFQFQLLFTFVWRQLSMYSKFLSTKLRWILVSICGNRTKKRIIGFRWKQKTQVLTAYKTVLNEVSHWERSWPASTEFFINFVYLVSNSSKKQIHSVNFFAFDCRFWIKLVKYKSSWIWKVSRSVQILPSVIELRSQNVCFKIISDCVFASNRFTTVCDRR